MANISWFPTNERYFTNFADVEYTPRMRKAGWRLLLAPEAHVYCQPNTLSTPLREMPFSKLFHILFFNRRSHYNLVTLFLNRWTSAPNNFLGFLAYIITLVRMALRWAGILKKWPDRMDGWNIETG